MATFFDTVSALNPVLWARFDELTGTVAADSSVNAETGTYYPEAVLGRPSPIISDPSSFAVQGAAAHFPVTPENSAYTNFTWVVFGYLTEDESLDDNALIALSGQLGLAGSSFLAYANGDVQTRLRFSSTNYVLSYAGSNLVRGNWYMVWLRRNGTVVELGVNDAIVTSPLTVDSADLDPQGSTEWVFGRSSSANAHHSNGTDEPFILDYPWTLAQAIATYEAAIGATLLRGRSDANPTAILRSTFEPDPVSYPFRHNWTETLIERLSFRSAISQAITGPEEAVSEMEAPRRELEWMQVMRDNRERRKLRSLLWANQHRKWFIPIRQHAEQLLEPLAATSTITPILTAYKDYEIDSWIGFRQMSATGEIQHWEERRITSLNPNSVEHEALTNSYAAYRSIVYPVRRGLLRAQVSVTGHTDAVEEVTLTAQLMPEDEEVFPNRITQFSPTIKYRDVEVFDGRVWQSNDWSEQREYEIERNGEAIDFDTGLIGFESDTVGASETFSYRMTIQGIDQIAAFLGWYYERVGALKHLWVPTMQNDLDLIRVHTAQQITVRDTNYSDAFALAEPRRDLAFVYWDGSVALRRVTAFQVAEPDEILTLDANVPTTTNLRFISLLKYCRLDADQLELAWQTDNVIQVAWRFREVLDTPEGTGVSSLSPSASLSHSISPSGSPSPSASVSASLSASLSISPSSSVSPSSSTSPSHSASRSPSPSASTSPSSSASPST